MDLPTKVPVMTLPNAILFPQAIMPLYIFEPRYRKMVSDVLEDECMFAVAGLDEKLAMESDTFEPSFGMATIGVVRACHKNQDGTSNLVLQGLARVKVNRIVQEEPYRVIQVEPLQSLQGAGHPELIRLRDKLTGLLESKQRMGAEMPAQIFQFLGDIEDLDVFIDLAAYALCHNTPVKQQLLETLNTEERYQLFINETKREIEEMNLDSLLRGDLDDDGISRN